MWLQAAPGNLYSGLWQQFNSSTGQPVQPPTFTFLEEWRSVQEALKDNE